MLVAQGKPITIRTEQMFITLTPQMEITFLEQMILSRCVLAARAMYLSVARLLQVQILR